MGRYDILILQPTGISITKAKANSAFLCLPSNVKLF